MNVCLRIETGINPVFHLALPKPAQEIHALALEAADNFPKFEDSLPRVDRLFRQACLKGDF